MTSRRRTHPRGLESLGPRTLGAPSSDAYYRVVAAALDVESAEVRLREAVRDAVAAGDSWRMIGAAIGTSRQNAYQRFARFCRE